MFNATLIERKVVTDELLIMRIRPDGGVPDFKPGQYVAVGLPGTAPRPEGFPPDIEPQGDKLLKRAYSIGSSPLEKDWIELYIAVVPEGTLTPRLSVLKTGDRLFLAQKITGTFTVDGVAPEKNLILISTGTGVAPFISMIRTPQVCGDRKITIVHGVRYGKDLGYDEELLEFKKTHPTFTYIPIVTRDDGWQGKKGRVPTLFEDGTLPVDPVHDHIFMCGNPAMIEDLEKLLTDRNFTVHSKKNPSGTLHFEKYW
jgi:ferredoxin--NADP+ reductase